MPAMIRTFGYSRAAVSRNSLIRSIKRSISGSVVPCRKTSFPWFGAMSWQGSSAADSAAARASAASFRRPASVRSFPLAEPIRAPRKTFREADPPKTVRSSLKSPFSRFSSCFSDREIV